MYESCNIISTHNTTSSYHKYAFTYTMKHSGAFPYIWRCMGKFCLGWTDCYYHGIKTIVVIRLYCITFVHSIVGKTDASPLENCTLVFDLQICKSREITTLMCQMVSNWHSKILIILYCEKGCVLSSEIIISISKMCLWLYYIEYFMLRTHKQMTAVISGVSVFE